MSEVSLTKLYSLSEDYQKALSQVTPEVWQRWQLHKNEWYTMCKPQINYAVHHYTSCAPLNKDDVEGHANLIFCIACLRWDPKGSANLPTYVANQLRRLSGYEVRPQAKHKNEITTVITEEGEVDILSLIGSPAADNTLRDYVAKAGKDALLVYDRCMQGYYQRSSKAGCQRKLTARALLRAHVVPQWLNEQRYQQTLDRIQSAARAWRLDQDYKGFAALAR